MQAKTVKRNFDGEPKSPGRLAAEKIGGLLQDYAALCDDTLIQLAALKRRRALRESPVAVSIEGSDPSDQSDNESTSSNKSDSAGGSDPASPKSP